MEGKRKTKQCLPWKVFCRYAAWYIVRNVGGISAFRLNNLVKKKRSLASKWAQSCETESLISSDFLLCNGPIHMVFLGIRQKSNELAQYISYTLGSKGFLKYVMHPKQKHCSIVCLHVHLTTSFEKQIDMAIGFDILWF